MMRRFSNGLKTALLLGLLSALVLTAGYWLGGGPGLVVATVLAVLMNGFAYFHSDRIALRAMGARELRPWEAPELHATVRELAAAAGQPMPRVYLSPLAQPNAFATGRNPQNAAVCVTEGLLSLLTPRELRAVLGHEMSHVANRDILISTVAAGLASIITSVANLAFFFPLSTDDEDAPNPVAALLMLLIAPMAAGLIQLAVSRSREYQADLDGARITGDPLALASALQKIEHGAQLRPLSPDHGAVAQAHLMTASPLAGSGVAALFRTHPSAQDRVRRLRELAGTLPQQAGPRLERVNLSRMLR